MAFRKKRGTTRRKGRGRRTRKQKRIIRGGTLINTFKTVKDFENYVKNNKNNKNFYTFHYSDQNGDVEISHGKLGEVLK